MVRFVSSTPPLYDFCFFNLGQPLNISGVHQDVYPMGSLFHTATPRSTEIVSGNWIDQKYCYSGDPHLPLPTQNTSGCFTAVKIVGDYAHIYGDDFGQYPLYIFDDGSVKLCGNRLHLILEILKAANVTLTWDWCNAAPLLHPFYLGAQLATFETPIKNLRLLPVGHSIKFYGDRLPEEIAPPPPLEIKAKNYREFLYLGSSKIREMIGLTVNSVDALFLSLSGGIDSRMTLGAALPYLDKINIWSNRTNKKDWQIASALGIRYDGFFVNNRSLENYSLMGMEECIERIRSFGFGIYNLPRNGGSLTPEKPSPKVLGMGGSGGELYRNYVSEVLTLQTKIKIKDLQTKLSDLFSCEALSLQQKEISAISITQQIQNFDIDASLLRKVEHHYFQFRNRFHFGININGWSKGNWNIRPLMQQNLLRAAACLPEETLGKGQLVFDIMAYFDRYLPCFPYDTPQKSFSQSVIDNSIFKTESVDLSLNNLAELKQREVFRANKKITPLFSPSQLNEKLAFLFDEAIETFSRDSDFLGMFSQSPTHFAQFAKFSKYRDRYFCAIVGLRDLWEYTL